MTKATFGDLSTTATSNTVIDNNSVDENCPMTGLNNALRSLGAAGKGALTAVTTSGTDTYTATLAPAPDGLATDFLYYINFAGANTSTTPTLNLNSLGAKTITDMTGAALVAGGLNGRHLLNYDGTNFRVLNPAITPTATTATTVGTLTAAAIWSTGDVKMTLKTTADSGWVIMDDGTIGDASSSATTRANTDTSALFTLLWNNTADADCAVSTGRGASASADFAAHKTIALPKTLGRALAISGAGSGLTSRALAHVLGEETHTQTTAELPAHAHPGSTGSFSGTANGNVQTTSGIDGGVASASGSGSTGYTPAGSVSVSVASQGSGTAFNVMQPTSFLNIMIKL